MKEKTASCGDTLAHLVFAREAATTVLALGVGVTVAVVSIALGAACCSSTGSSSGSSRRGRVRCSGAVGRDSEVDHVIERTVLRNGDEDGLMVSSGVDRCHAVDTSIKTVSNIGGHDTVHLSGVDTLEEGEDIRVIRRCLVKSSELLNDDVSVSDDVALGVDCLGRRVVVALGVDEVTGLKVVERHRDSEVLVGSDSVTVLGEDELAGRHVRGRCNDTHRGRVAGTSLDLLTVGDRQVGHRQTEVNEVV